MAKRRHRNPPDAIGLRHESDPSRISDVDCDMFPGLLSGPIIALRYDLDEYYSRFSSNFDGLRFATDTQIYAAMTNVVVDCVRGANHELQYKMRKHVDQTFGQNGDVTIPAWYPIDEEVDEDFLTQVSVAFTSPEFAQAAKTLALEQRTQLLEHCSTIGISYDEKRAAEEDVVARLDVLKRVRTSEIGDLLNAIGATMDIREKPSEDDLNVTILDWDVEDENVLRTNVRKLGKHFGEMKGDFIAWFLRGYQESIEGNYRLGDERVESYAKTLLGGAIRNHIEVLRRLLEFHMVHEQARSVAKVALGAEDLPPDDLLSSDDGLEISPQPVPATIDIAVSKLGDIEDIRLVREWLVSQNYPWMPDDGREEPTQIQEYRVNGSSAVYVANALSESLADIADKVTRRLLKRNTFELLTLKAVKGVIAGKRYDIEKFKGGGQSQGGATYYDGFIIHKEKGGRGGNATRLYFVLTKPSAVVGDVPEGIDPEAPLIVVVACTDKNYQDTVLWQINGAPLQTARRRGSGS